jgi:DNA-binding NtrC family response regulator
VEAETQVLIFGVEDHHLVQEALQGVLKDAGFAVSAANTAENAFEMLDAKGADFRALITDVNLGKSELTGWDVAQHAREINDQIPVVYMTGASSLRLHGRWRRPARWYSLASMIATRSCGPSS